MVLPKACTYFVDNAMCHICNLITLVWVSHAPQALQSLDGCNTQESFFCVQENVIVHLAKVKKECFGGFV